MEKRNDFLHFWQAYEFGKLRLFLKNGGWSIRQAFNLSDPSSEIRFTSVGGYDPNNSYYEHNNWEGGDVFHEPVGLAAQVYRMRGTPEAILEQLIQLPFVFSRFAYEDGNGCFFQGQDNGLEMVLHITIPVSFLNSFIPRFLTFIPELSMYLYKEEAMHTWYVLLNKRKVASFYFTESLFEFQEYTLRSLLENTESVFHFSR